MADGHGGYRQPANPAPVSGPGRYSQRTDGHPAQVMSAAPDQAYGDQKAQLDAQRIAPMAGTAPMPHPAPVAPQGQGQQAAPPSAPQFPGGPFNAPSARPNEPVTAGVDIGPGPGSSVLSAPIAQQGAGTGAMTAMLQRLSATDTTGILGKLMMAAQARGA